MITALRHPRDRKCRPYGGVLVRWDRGWGRIVLLSESDSNAVILSERSEPKDLTRIKVCRLRASAK